MSMRNGPPSETGGRGRGKKPKHLSTRSSDAKTIKITMKAWETLRHVKFELDSPSYSDSIIFMNENPGQGSKDLPERIKEKVPGERSRDRKTIVISKKAHDVLRHLKFQFYLESYSDAITHLAGKVRGI